METRKLAASFILFFFLAAPLASAPYTASGCTIIISSPNGGEKYFAGDKLAVSWEMTSPCTHFLPEISVDGVAWQSFGSGNLEGRAAELPLPNAPSERAYLRLRGFDSFGSELGADESDSSFEILRASEKLGEVEKKRVKLLVGEPFAIGGLELVATQMGPLAESYPILFQLKKLSGQLIDNFSFSGRLQDEVKSAGQLYRKNGVSVEYANSALGGEETSFVEVIVWPGAQEGWNQPDGGEYSTKCSKPPGLVERVACRIENKEAYFLAPESCRELSTYAKAACRKAYIETAPCFERPQGEWAACGRSALRMQKMVGRALSCAEKQFGRAACVNEFRRDAFQFVEFLVHSLEEKARRAIVQGADKQQAIEFIAFVEQKKKDFNAAESIQEKKGAVASVREAWMEFRQETVEKTTG